MKILLTRSKKDNDTVRRELLDKLPYGTTQIYSMNLLKFLDVDFDFSKIANYRNIIVTSKYAASIIAGNWKGFSKAQAEINPNKNITINFWIVGKLSAKILQDKISAENIDFRENQMLESQGLESQELKSQGLLQQPERFKIAKIANSAMELIEALNEYNPDSLQATTQNSISEDEPRSYAYLSGNIITMDMPSFVDRYEIYNSSYKKSLNLEEIAILKQGIDLIAVYSENCAKTLIHLLKSSNLTKYVENVAVITISSKVARALESMFTNIVIAADPSIVTEEILKICQKKITK